MNRRTELFDNRLADWLEDDPFDAPPQLLETVLAALPSIPQRHVRPWSFASPAQVRASLRLLAIAAVLIASVALLALVGATIVNPKATPLPSSPPGLPTSIEVPLRFYSINLTPAWLVSLTSGTTGVDTFNGDEGRLDVRFALIPAGTGQDAWADAYFVRQMAATGGCPSTDPGAWDPVRVGQDTGRIYALDCLPGWMAMFAVGDRGYDIRFTIRGGQDAANARTVFEQILTGMTFDRGPTPKLALSTFTSSRYGYSIGYPSGWTVTSAARDLGPSDIPWASGDQVDLMSGPDPVYRSQRPTNTGTTPGQPTSGELDLAATPLPPGMTLAAFTANTAGIACGNGAGTPITVDGETGSIVEYDNCQGDYHQWVTVLHAGRGYHILYLDAPGSEDFDRYVFQQILGTFRFGGASPSPSP
jgi:hypothetical protein